MRFHDERAKRLHSMRCSQIQRPIKRSQEVPLQDEEIADDSLMVTVCYEAHISMQQMLAAFAEMRGDDTEGPAGQAIGT